MQSPGNLALVPTAQCQSSAGGRQLQGVPACVPCSHEWTGLLQAKGQKRAAGLIDHWVAILENPKPRGLLLANGHFLLTLYSLPERGCGGRAACPQILLLPQTRPAPTETPAEPRAPQNIVPWALGEKHTRMNPVYGDICDSAHIGSFRLPPGPRIQPRWPEVVHDAINS